MKLDTVTTIAIGDINALGHRMPDYNWSTIQRLLTATANAYGTVVGTFHGDAITSDQPTEQQEQSFLVLVINVTDLDHLRHNVAELLQDFYLSSACFSTDAKHEPVFPTADGFRPPTTTTTATAYAPTHGGYPNV